MFTYYKHGSNLCAPNINEHMMTSIGPKFDLSPELALAWKFVFIPIFM